jgi:phage regulator Rha-like protein
MAQTCDALAGRNTAAQDVDRCRADGAGLDLLGKLMVKDCKPFIPCRSGAVHLAQGPITMSSHEIAELVEKRHDNVLRDIEKMLQDIGDPKFGASSFEAENITPQNKRAKEYLLPRDLTVTLITGYRADLRFKVIKRLEELDAQRTPAMLTGPQLLAAALIEANATLQVQTQQIEAMRDDVTALERIAMADGSLSVTEAAKNLGLRPKDLLSLMARAEHIRNSTGFGGVFGGVIVTPWPSS